VRTAVGGQTLLGPAHSALQDIFPDAGTGLQMEKQTWRQERGTGWLGTTLVDCGMLCESVRSVRQDFVGSEVCPGCAHGVSVHARLDNCETMCVGITLERAYLGRWGLPLCRYAYGVGCLLLLSQGPKGTRSQLGPLV
jgi:hypothetical protein